MFIICEIGPTHHKKGQYTEIDKKLPSTKNQQPITKRNSKSDVQHGYPQQELPGNCLKRQTSNKEGTTFDMPYITLHYITFRSEVF